MSDFKNTDLRQWEERARKDLKTEESYLKIFHTWDGLTISPYYDKENLPPSLQAFDNRFSSPDPTGARARIWYNVEGIQVTDPSKANAAALELLMQGAEGIHFQHPGGDNFSTLMQDIQPEYIQLVFTLDSLVELAELRHWMEKLDIDRKDFKACIIMKEEDAELAEEIARFESWPNVRLINLTLDADCDEPVRDLTGIMIQVSSFFERHIDRFSPTLLARHLTFRVNIGPKYFQEIIRLRALRVVLYKLCRAWGAELEPEALMIHAVSRPWIRENFQPQGNMIKSATAAMSGILGGCDLLTVMPEDPSSELHMRIARNVSTILKEESYLDRTLDPLAGAYFIESMTDTLARQAWMEFQKTASS